MMRESALCIKWGIGCKALDVIIVKAEGQERTRQVKSVFGIEGVRGSSYR